MKNLIYLFVFFSNVGYSQSFKPITTNSKINLYYSEIGDQSIRGFRIDTVVKDGEFEVVNFHKEFNDNWNCVKPFSASWLGEKCVIDTAEQIAYFFNEFKDTLVLHYSKQVGFEWNFYKKGNICIKAKVIGINIETLANGEEQSVKSIQLYKYNSSGKDEWEKQKFILKISENNGFTQVIVFKTLPELYKDYRGYELPVIKLMPNRIIKLSDIYNYDVGDVFEYYVRNDNGPTNLHIIEVLKKYSFTKYLLKNSYQYNIVKIPLVIKEVKVTIDTFKIIKNDTIFNSNKILPMETFNTKFAEPHAIFKRVFYNDNLYNFPSGSEGFFYKKNKDTCWTQRFEAPYYGRFEYKEGYGYTIQNEEWGVYQWREFEKMFFSKKGNKTTGTFVPLGLDEIKSKGKFSLYPNPSTKTVFINSGNLKIEGYKVCSIGGQTLIEASDYNKNEGINISNLANGLYFINIQSTEGNSTIRFLKTENK